jgi:hypothetical protein
VGAIKLVVGVLEKHKLYLAGEQGVWREEERYQTAVNCTFFYGKGNVNHELRIGRFLYNSIPTEKMSYINLQSRWCDIILLNVHAPTEDKVVIVKYSFHEEIKLAVDQFPVSCESFTRRFQSKCKERGHF